jgi:hypothetical protein
MHVNALDESFTELPTYFGASDIVLELAGLAESTLLLCLIPPLLRQQCVLPHRFVKIPTCVQRSVVYLWVDLKYSDLAQAPIILHFKMATIPKQHKAAVYAEPGKLLTKIEAVDTPEPDPGEPWSICMAHSSYPCHTNELMSEIEAPIQVCVLVISGS